MSYDPKKEWSKAVLKNGMAFPAEYVIRIFRGTYPRLNLDKDFNGKKICDVGCGDGRNLVLLKQCGFDVSGMEITQKIVDRVKVNLKNLNIKAEIKTGTNDNIPFRSDYFDYLLSWNTCYYMGHQRDFSKYVEEFARILKSEGFLILSIPKKTCFIYNDSEKNAEFRIIRNDPFNVRNGEVLRIFENEDEIKRVFSTHFKNFVFGSVEDDCFGFNYHWHLVVCQKNKMESI